MCCGVLECGLVCGFLSRFAWNFTKHKNSLMYLQALETMLATGKGCILPRADFFVGKSVRFSRSIYKFRCLGVIPYTCGTFPQVLCVFFSPPELSDSVSLSPADRMQALCLKLALLGKNYAGTPRYFPLGKSLACLDAFQLSF